MLLLGNIKKLVLLPDYSIRVCTTRFTPDFFDLIYIVLNNAWILIFVLPSICVMSVEMSHSCNDVTDIITSYISTIIQEIGTVWSTNSVPTVNSCIPFLILCAICNTFLGKNWHFCWTVNCIYSTYGPHIYMSICNSQGREYHFSIPSRLQWSLSQLIPLLIYSNLCKPHVFGVPVTTCQKGLMYAMQEQVKAAKMLNKWSYPKYVISGQ